MSNTRKVTGLKPPRDRRREADAIVMALIRGFRTGDNSCALMLGQADKAVIGTVIAILSTVTAGLSMDVPDERLETFVSAAYLRGMRRPGR